MIIGNKLRRLIQRRARPPAKALITPDTAQQQNTAQLTAVGADSAVGTSIDAESEAGSPTGPEIPELQSFRHGTGWGTKAKPLAAYRRRLCCFEQAVNTQLAKSNTRSA
jgi:hypothetical protein